MERQVTPSPTRRSNTALGLIVAGFIILAVLLIIGISQRNRMSDEDTVLTEADKTEIQQKEKEVAQLRSETRKNAILDKLEKEKCELSSSTNATRNFKCLKTTPATFRVAYNESLAKKTPKKRVPAIKTPLEELSY